jgi:hypothetical protein
VLHWQRTGLRRPAFPHDRHIWRLGQSVATQCVDGRPHRPVWECECWRDLMYGHTRPIAIPYNWCDSNWVLYIYIYSTNYINFVETIVYLGLMNPMAARPKDYVCGRSLGGIAGSNFAGGWTSVCLCKCSVLPSRGLCDGQILRPEESDRVWCVYECELSVTECDQAVQ